MFPLRWMLDRLPAWVPMLLAAVLMASIPGTAHALTCSATITDVDFGTVSPLSSSATDTLATLRITCTSIPSRSAVKICASLADGSGGSSGSARLMTGPSNATLSYQLFQDSSRTRGWGSTDNAELGTVPAFSLGNGSSSSATGTATLYARLYGGQTSAPPGSFVSSYTGAETALTYAAYSSGATSTCDGFSGTGVIRPEFDVTAKASAGCSVTTTDLVFPATGILSTALQGQASLGVTCTSKTAYSVTMDNGTTGTSPTARKMVSTSDASVTYGLYRNSARTLAWGTGSLAASGSGIGGAQTLTVYGLVPVQPTPAPASYSDRVVVTLTY